MATALAVHQLQPIRILIVDDHPVFCEGLSKIIGLRPDMRLVAQASSALAALAEFRRHRPDITLMDIGLPGGDGTDALIAIREEFPEARVIMLTTWESGEGDLMARVFITGSADGLGLMAGRLLFETGHRVVLHARNPKRAEETRQRLPTSEAVVVGDLANGIGPCFFGTSRGGLALTS